MGEWLSEPAPPDERVGDAVTVLESVPLPVAQAQGVAVGDAEPDSVADSVPLPVAALPEAATDGDAEVRGDADAELLSEGVTEVEGQRLTVGLNEVDTETGGEGLLETEAPPDADVEGDDVLVAHAVAKTVVLALPEAEGEGERVGESEGSAEVEAQGEGERVGDAEGDAEPLPEALRAEEALPAPPPLREGGEEPDARALSVDDTVAEKVGDTEKDALGEGVGEPEPEPRGVAEGDAETEASLEGAGAADAVAPPPGEPEERREGESGGEVVGEPPVALPLRDAATLPVAPARPSKEGVREPEDDVVALPPPPPMLRVDSRVFVGDALGDSDAEGATDSEGDSVGVGELEGELGGVPVRSTVPDAPNDAEGALDAVAEEVAHAVDVAAGVDVCEPDAELRTSGERDVEPEAV